MPCCGKTPFETLHDRMTLDDNLVTCKKRAEVGNLIRSGTYGTYRMGEWAEVKVIGTYIHRECYVVQFDDGAMDIWVIDDADAQYEIMS